MSSQKHAKISLIFLVIISVALAQNDGYPGYDDFIVNEDPDSITPKKSSNKRTDIVMQNSQKVKPVVRGMAMSLRPKNPLKITEGPRGYLVGQENTKKELHIAPTIDLARTLKTLDKIGEKVDVKQLNNTEHSYVVHLPSPKQDSESMTRVTVAKKVEKQSIGFLPNNIKNVTQQQKLEQIASSVNETVAKKHSQPNVITDSPIKGFLGNDVNFTISDVGKQNKKRSERKMQKSTSENENLLNNTTMATYMNNSTKISVANTTSKDVINATQGVSINATHTDIINSLLNKENHTSSLSNTLNFTAPILKNSSYVNQTDNSINSNIRFNSSTQGGSKKTIHSRQSKPKLHMVDATEFTKLPKIARGFNTGKTLKKDSIDEAHDECQASKDCPKNKYCRHHICFQCHRKHHECTEDDQCCDDFPCVYGRCDKKQKGSPGTICEKDKDCGDDGCCVIEPTIDEEHGICKRKLEEFHQCSPVLFRKVWVGDTKPVCGPCKDGLECTEKGVIASHLVCMKKKA